MALPRRDSREWYPTPNNPQNSPLPHSRNLILLLDKRHAQTQREKNYSESPLHSQGKTFHGNIDFYFALVLITDYWIPFRSPTCIDSTFKKYIDLTKKTTKLRNANWTERRKHACLSIPDHQQLDAAWESEYFQHAINVCIFSDLLRERSYLTFI